MRKTSIRVRRFFLVTLTGGLLISGPHPVSAEKANRPAKVEWSSKGVNGTFDRTELRRGFQVYTEVCAACHGLRHMRYEKLKALGFSEEDIKAIAKKYEVPGDLNSDGEQTMRPAEPKDAFVGPFVNEVAARAANNGAYPPDLSLIVKARPGGADYIYALLTGYTTCPSDFNLAEGMYYNPYFSGNQIAMAPPLSIGLVEYPDRTKASIKQMAHDVTVFLSWAAEPEMEERKHMGIMVLIFVFVFAAMMFVLNRRTWKSVS